MHSYVALCIMSIVVLHYADCRRVARNHLNHRRNQQTLLFSTRIITYPTKPITSPNETQTFHQANPQLGQAAFPTGNVGYPPVAPHGLPHQGAGLQPGGYGSYSPGAGLPIGGSGAYSAGTGLQPGGFGSYSPGAGLPIGGSGAYSSGAGLQPGGYGLPPVGSGFASGSAGLPPGGSGLPPGGSGLPPGGLPLAPVGTRLPTEGPGFSPSGAQLTPRKAREPPEITEPISESDEFSSESTTYSTSTDSTTSFLSLENLSPAIDFVTSSSDSFPEPVSTSTLHPDLKLSRRNMHLKRRRKNVPESRHKGKTKFRKGKAKETALSHSVHENDRLKDLKDYLENDATDRNSTVIPIPRGMQIKTVSKLDDGKVRATMNITSSTQIFSVDNATEIENVVEMQMEKKIEDEKGANMGSEEVRMIETEYVKPIVNKKWKGLNIRKRKRKSYRKRFVGHHRNRRSLTHSTETPRSNSVFNKMARRFLSKVRRKERVAENDHFSHRQITAHVENGESDLATGMTLTRDELMHERDEMDDFMKFFLKQMRKFRKSRERSSMSSRRFNSTDGEKDVKRSRHKIKKNYKSFEYPEHMNVFMNFNMTWDTEIKERINKSKVATGNGSYATLDFEITTIASMPSTEQKTLMLDVYYTGEKKDSRYLSAVMIFSAVTFLFMSLTCIKWGKLCKAAQFNHRISEAKGHQFYSNEGQIKRVKGLQYMAIKNECIEDCPQLEWQSENGDWIPDKETYFK